MVLPGAIIGIVGGGQLGRMLALAARRMGYRIWVIAPTDDTPAAQVADRCIVAEYDDLAAAEYLARNCDVATVEFENIPADTLETIGKHCIAHPRPEVLGTCRHRLREKEFLQSRGFQTAPFHPVHNVDELAAALGELDGEGILKSTAYGYDGKGQVRIRPGDNVSASWESINHDEGVLEGVVPFDCEMSVIAARTPDGDVACFDPVVNEHRDHILDVTLAPAPVSGQLKQQAIDIGAGVIGAIEMVGVLCVELFAVGDQLLINELAPRPHNSGHHTIEAALTSQFEQHVRCICNLPLGDTSLRSPAVMANLLGDTWENGEPAWQEGMKPSGVYLHLYGKHEGRPKRKMGHITALGESVEQARNKATAVRAAVSNQSYSSG